MNILLRLGRLSILPILLICWNVCGILDFISFFIGGTNTPYMPIWRLSYKIIHFARKLMTEFNY